MLSLCSQPGLDSRHVHRTGPGGLEPGPHRLLRKAAREWVGMPPADVPRAQDPRDLIEEVRGFLRKNLWSVEKLAEACYTSSGGAFSCADFERQMQYAIPSMLLDDACTTELARMSLCDQCCTIHSMQPKMLACAGCKDTHYCDRDCQKKHWERTHRVQCSKTQANKLETRVLSLCIKMLVVMTMSFDDENGLISNSRNSHLMEHVEANPHKDYLYIAALFENNVLYVPVPTRVFDYLMSMPFPAENASMAPKCPYMGRVVLMTPTSFEDKDGRTRVGFLFKHTFISMPA